MLDVLVAGAVEEPPRTAPPATPAAGACYIVGNGGTGDWLGRDGEVAAYTSGGWRYLPPVDGTALLVRSSGDMARHIGGSWELGLVRGAKLMIDGAQVVCNRGNAIADPAGGAQVDTEARAAIGAILAELRRHGLIAS